MAKKVFDWKVAAKKFAWNLGFTLVAGLIVIWQDDPKYVVVVPLLLAAQNWLKHRR